MPGFTGSGHRGTHEYDPDCAELFACESRGGTAGSRPGVSELVIVMSVGDPGDGLASV